MLIGREDLARADPDSVPVLTAWGRARQSVLQLCDGKRALGQVEREVFRRHRDLFATQAEASTFTAEVVTIYSR
jgi:hypothetical protein